MVPDYTDALGERISRINLAILELAVVADGISNHFPVVPRGLPIIISGVEKSHYEYIQ